MVRKVFGWGRRQGALLLTERWNQLLSGFAYPQRPGNWPPTAAFVLVSPWHRSVCNLPRGLSSLPFYIFIDSLLIGAIPFVPLSARWFAFFIGYVIYAESLRKALLAQFLPVLLAGRRGVGGLQLHHSTSSSGGAGNSNGRLAEHGGL